MTTNNVVLQNGRCPNCGKALPPGLLHSCPKTGNTRKAVLPLPRSSPTEDRWTRPHAPNPKPSSSEKSKRPHPYQSYPGLNMRATIDLPPGLPEDTSYRLAAEDDSEEEVIELCMATIAEILGVNASG